MKIKKCAKYLGLLTVVLFSSCMGGVCPMGHPQCWQEATTGPGGTVQRYFFYGETNMPDVFGGQLNANTGTVTAVPGGPYPLKPVGISGNLAIGSSHFLYAPDPNLQSIYAFSIDPVTGQLSSLSGSPYSVGTPASYVVLHPNLPLLYTGTGNVTGVPIGADGTLGSPSAAGPLGGGGAIWYLTVHSTGKWAYARAGSAGVCSRSLNFYTVDPATGVLTYQTCYGTGGNIADQVYVDPTGQYLYGVSIVGQLIYAFSIDQATGAITHINDYPLPGQPAGAAFNSAHNLLYVAGGGDLSIYKISAGALTPVAGSPFTFATTGFAFSQVVLDPTGIYLIARDYSTSGRVFPLDASGLPVFTTPLGSFSPSGQPSLMGPGLYVVSILGAP